MRLKILNGTPEHGESLCRTCRNSTVIKGHRESEEFIACDSISGYQPMPVPFESVSKCSRYDDKRIPSRRDMEDIAWVLVTDNRTRQIGFISAKEARKRKDLDDTPWPV
jgi:hypothetical protein